MTVVVFLLALAATARVTRFIVADALAQPARDWVAVHKGPTSRWYTLITCTWCASIWVGAVAVTTGWWWGHAAWWQLITAWLAVSYLVSVTATWLDPAE